MSAADFFRNINFNPEIRGEIIPTSLQISQPSRQAENALERQAANQLANQLQRQAAAQAAAQAANQLQRQADAAAALLRGPSTVTPNAAASVVSVTDAQALSASSQGVPVTGVFNSAGAFVPVQSATSTPSVSEILTGLNRLQPAANAEPEGLAAVPVVVWVAAGFIAVTGLLLRFAK